MLELHRSIAINPSTTEDDMAKGQMRSNKEKKKPKQDKNIKKGGTQTGKK